MANGTSTTGTARTGTWQGERPSGDPRDYGLGLNYARGFQTRPGFMAMSRDLEGEHQALQQGWGRQQAELGRQFQAQQAGLGRQHETSQLNLQLGQRERESVRDAALRQQQMDIARGAQQASWNRYASIAPYLTQALGQAQAGYRGAGQVGNQPEISAAPVYNQQQIQQQVNAQKAATDLQTAGQIRRMQEQQAGRMGAQGPLAQALAAMYQGQGLAASTAAERETRMNAAQMNAAQVLRGQTAQEQQFAS